MKYFKFEIIHKSKRSGARVGRIHTPNGTIDTPSFVGVGTNGTMKSIDNNMIKNIGLELMFCNTYHLMLQPGVDVIKKAGGLHKFINRDMPLITDSGGFQVFSLAYGSVANELKSQGKKRSKNLVLKINEEGVLFRSYRDGEKMLLTPETSIKAQKGFGADIIIPFDELPPYHMKRDSLIHSLERTHRWEKRSLDEHEKNKNNQAIYGVCHGGICPELREKSAKYIGSLAFDGFAIGGSVGKNKKEMVDMLKNVMPYLQDGRPIHLLGIGDIPSIESIIPLGIDTFDSSYPTKAARHGMVFTNSGGVKITRSSFKGDYGPLEEGCSCFACQNYSKAYIHHLFKSKELIGFTLSSIHNIHFMVELMKKYREKILVDAI